MAGASPDELCIWALARWALTHSTQLLANLYLCLCGKKGASSGIVLVAWPGVPGSGLAVTAFFKVAAETGGSCTASQLCSGCGVQAAVRALCAEAVSHADRQHVMSGQLLLSVLQMKYLSSAEAQQTSW